MVGIVVPFMSETPSETGFDWDSPLYPQDTHDHVEPVEETFGRRDKRVQHRALAALVYADKLSESVLSQRQAEVWALTRTGFSQRDVADLLDLDASTVSDYAQTAKRKVAQAIRFATELNLSLYEEASMAMGHDIPEPNGVPQYSESAPWGKPYKSGRQRRNMSRLVKYENEEIWYESGSETTPPTMTIIRSFIDYGCEEGAAIIQRTRHTGDENGYTTEGTTRVYGSAQEMYDAELNDREFESPLDLFGTYRAVSSISWDSIPNPLVVYGGEITLRDAFEPMEQNLVTPELLAGMVTESQQVLATDVLPAKQNDDRTNVPDTVLQPSDSWGE